MKKRLYNEKTKEERFFSESKLFFVKTVTKKKVDMKDFKTIIFKLMIYHYDYYGFFKN